MKHIISGIIVLIIILSFNNKVYAQDNMIDELVAKNNYEKAIEVITAKGDISELKNDALESLGYCYIMVRDLENAEPVYKELVDRNSQDYSLLYYAEILFFKQKYSEAKINYDKYLNIYPNHDYAKLKSLSCDSILVWQQQEQKNTAINYELVNTENDERSGFLIDNNFYYLSNNATKVLDTTTSLEIANPNWIDNTIWCYSYTYYKSQNLIAYSIRNNSVKFQNDFDSAFICYDNLYNKNIDDINVFNWADKPKNFNIAHPCFENDGNRIYFASDIPGGFGGMDIYYSDFNGSEWTKPVNLGENINTMFDELSPYFWQDTLFFSSDGLPGYGHYDVFYSIVTNDKYSKPINLKAPVNSPSNDLFFYLSNPGKAYLSSDRTEGKGKMDIYIVNLESKQDSVIQEPKIYVFDPNTFALPFILFNFDENEIWPEYNSVIKQIADTLIKYDYVNLKIKGYADISGTNEYNVELSTARAQNIANSLINYGANESQITFNGYGELKEDSLAGIKYHLILGSLNDNTKADWYSNLINNEYKIDILHSDNKYFYCIGDFNDYDSALEFSIEFKKKHNVNYVIGASYLENYLPNYKRAINRRVELVFQVNK